MTDLRLFTGNAYPMLAQRIADKLAIPVGKAVVSHFRDGETMVEILENIRGRDVFIIQSTCAPVNENLMELLLMADAMRRASAGRITAVVPYFGYARQDRRVRSARVPITAKVVADMMTAVGIDRIMTVDLHADQIQGFFYIPVDNIYASTVLLEDIRKKAFAKPVIVSPDVGGVIRARAVAKRLDDTELAIIDKRRPEPNQSEVMHIIGDVKNRDCIIVDDIVDTAGTISNAAAALKEQGAHSVTCYATHPVLSDCAIDTIATSAIDELVVADTIPLHDKALQCKKIRQITLANVLAEAIHRVHADESISEMFTEK